MLLGNPAIIGSNEREKSLKDTDINPSRSLEEGGKGHDVRSLVHEGNCVNEATFKENKIELLNRCLEARYLDTTLLIG